MNPPLAVIGGGNMAGAILRGAGSVLDGEFVVADPNADRRALFSCSVASAAEAIAWLAEHEEAPGQGRVLLAIKPQVLPELARELAAVIGSGAWGRERGVISILAGASLAAVRRACGGRARVIRVMPNTPALVGRGMSAMSHDAASTEDDRQFARAIFESVGRVLEIEESQMDAFTAVAGSGPAYVFLLAEAMVRGAVESGLCEEDALLTVRETIAGTGLLLADGDERPAALRERVTSKGGTTAAALDVLRDGNFEDIIVRAIAAATARGRALGEISGGG